MRGNRLAQACTLLLSLFSLLLLVSSQGSYNDICGPSMHCIKNASLICANERCICGNGTFNEQYSFNLTWDNTKKVCVGRNESACIGTRSSKAKLGMKQVGCLENYSCLQITGMPPGTGVCKPVPNIYNYGINCNESKYCDSSRGLVCGSGNICVCAGERIDTFPKYQLIWEPVGMMCVGGIGSGCIGTKETPVPLGQKGVNCVPEGECVQETGHTPGVGICKRKTGVNSAGELRNSMITSTGILLGSYLVLSLFAY